MIGTALLLLSSAVSASLCSDEFNRAGRSGLINCMEAELRTTNEDLRVAWVGALERAKSEDSRKRGNAPTLYQDRFSSEAALIRAQRAWNAFREHHCKVQEFSMWGGIGAGSLHLGCMIELATLRKNDLLKYSATGQF